jgi:Flp pilus assembly protein TadD
LKLDRDFPPLTIDTESFASALEIGALDECLGYVRRIERSGGPDASLNCRLAEALFHHGRCEEALECGRRAVARAPGHAETLHLCAWLFSNCGCHDEAASAYQCLLELYPNWTEGYRHASGSLSARSRHQ